MTGQSSPQKAQGESARDKSERQDEAVLRQGLALLSYAGHQPQRPITYALRLAHTSSRLSIRDRFAVASGEAGRPDLTTHG